MTARLTAANNPSLFAMSYDRAAARVTDLILVPSHFFTPQIIAARKPLGPHARRAGWQGCNILIGKVPASGRIRLIHAGVPAPRAEVRAAWTATRFLRDEGLKARGWLLAVMGAVEAVGRPEFTLDEVYAQEARLQALYPGNNNVRPKIRQQLQVLRDRGWLAFGDRRGTYRRTDQPFAPTPAWAKDIASPIHNRANKKRTPAFRSHPSRATPVFVGGFLTKAQPLPAPPASPDPARIRFLHVRCLRPGCGHDAVIDAARRFAGRALPAEGLSARFLCECGARTAHVSHETRKPKRDNGCGWL